MYYKTVSSKAVIAKVYRDLGLNHSGWISDSFEWIGEALEIIGHSAGYVKQNIPHTVKEYKTKLKCNVQAIEGIMYNNRKLPPNDAISNFTFSDIGSVGDWYTLNPNYIHTSFESGTIYVFADTIAVDNEGYPLVPDEVLHKEAIKWYILMMLLAKGYKHPVFKYEDAEKRWMLYYPQAQNAGNFPSIDEYESFRQMWTALIPVQNPGSTFFDNINIDNPTSFTISPRDNERTIIHITDTTDDIIGGGGLP